MAHQQIVYQMIVRYTADVSKSLPPLKLPPFIESGAFCVLCAALTNTITTMRAGLLRIAQDPHRSIQRICDELLEGFLAEIQQAGRCDGTRVLPVLLKHASDTDHTRSRTLALTWLAAVLPLDPRSALVHAPAVIDVALPTLSTSHVDAVREVAVSINQRLRSIVAEAAPTGDHAPAADAEALDFGATVMALAQQLTVKSVTTRLAALRWILMLHRALPDKLYDHTQQITPVLLQSVFEPSDRVSRLALECVAEISSWPLPAPTAEQEALAHRAFADFVVAMLTMDDGQRRLVSRGAFVLCALGGFLGPATVSPMTVYSTVARCVHLD
eukprot:m.1264980 g.1264980  ORF g.1264980 m.1264980 type:complete len:328 (+) comp24736_c0_seq26:241-1224(+)